MHDKCVSIDYRLSPRISPFCTLNHALGDDISLLVITKADIFLIFPLLRDVSRGESFRGNVYPSLVVMIHGQVSSAAFDIEVNLKDLYN